MAACAVPMARERLLLVDAVGRFVVEEVLAPNEHPLFDCSAVDGYAMGAPDREGFHVIGIVAAGERPSVFLQQGQCVRIFTGAPVPQGADRVVMQEHCTLDGGLVQVQRAVPPGANIRQRGEQVRSGDVIIGPGSKVDPPTIGLLASVGVEQVHVACRPRIAIVRTGGEFMPPGGRSEARIFSSNDLMLDAAIQREFPGVRPTHLSAVDQEERLSEALTSAMTHSDVVICTGGVSVGDHDLVRPVLEKLGADIVFHRVAQKPGKPMLFAKHGEKAIFGLPGNPRAVMVLFWEYVLPFLRMVQGSVDPWPATTCMPLQEAVEFNGERAEFRAAVVRDGTVVLLRDEGSHMLRSLIAAEAIACLPMGNGRLKGGESIEIHYLPK